MNRCGKRIKSMLRLSFLSISFQLYFVDQSEGEGQGKAGRHNKYRHSFLAQDNSSPTRARFWPKKEIFLRIISLGKDNPTNDTKKLFTLCESGDIVEKKMRIFSLKWSWYFYSLEAHLCACVSFLSPFTDNNIIKN